MINSNFQVIRRNMIHTFPGFENVYSSIFFFLLLHPDLAMIRLGIQLEMKDNNLILQTLLTTFMAGCMVHVGSFKPNFATCPK